MATQDGSGIPFSFHQHQQAFRLLELPQQLLDLITSDAPPVLKLKSGEASTASGSPSPSPAVLCTPSETYQIRQVHSSNSIFLIRPFNIDDSGTQDSTPQPTASIIASAKATLELQKTSVSPALLLRQHLPLYNGLQDEEGDFDMMEMSPVGNSKDKKTKVALFESLPVSDGECQLAWLDLCAYEEDGAAWRPSAKALLAIWKALFSAATADGLPLDSQFKADDLWELIADDGYPHGLFQAVLKSSAEDDYAGNGWAVIDRSKCITWMGVLLLESQHKDNLKVSDFLADWQGHVPDAWGDAVALELLKDRSWQPTPTTIRIGQKQASLHGLESVPTASNSKSTGGSRNWHEKFRNSTKP